MHDVALLLAALLAACSADEAEAPDAEGPAVAESHVIPVDYRGRWAESAAACLVESSRRYEIAATRIDRPDFAGRVDEVVLTGPTANVRLEARGGQVEFRMVLEDENTMRASYGARGEFTLLRCR